MSVIREETITPDEAARRMGITPNYLRMEMRKGNFPVGIAFNPNGLKWIYCIPREAFEKWMSGELNADTLAEKVADKVMEKLKGA